jgi:hypothetical protein
LNKFNHSRPKQKASGFDFTDTILRFSTELSLRRGMDESARSGMLLELDNLVTRLYAHTRNDITE